MCQACLESKFEKKFQWEVSQIANNRFPVMMLLGGLSVNLNHLKIKKHACTFCTARFTFYMQLLRHIEKRQKLGVCPIMKQKF